MTYNTFIKAGLMLLLTAPAPSTPNLLQRPDVMPKTLPLQTELINSLPASRNGRPALEYITSKKLILHIETNKQTIHREFDSYAQLFDYGTNALSDLPGGTEMFTHTDEQWKNRGDHLSE